METDVEIDLEVEIGTMNETTIVIMTMTMSAVVVVTEVMLDPIESTGLVTESDALMRATTATLTLVHSRITALSIATAAMLARRSMIAEADIGDMTLCRTRGIKVITWSVVGIGERASGPNILILALVH